MGAVSPQGTTVGRRPARDAVAELIAGTGSPVLAFVGEAGVGKSHMVRFAEDAARSAGMAVIRGVAQRSDADMPLSVFQDAVRGALRDTEASDEGDPLGDAFPALLLPELGGSSDMPAAERGVLFEGAVRWFRHRGRGGGVLVALEDLHWADSSSHALAFHIARSCGDGVALVLTYRSVPPTEARSLAQMQQDLARARLVTELRLEPFSSIEIEEHLTALLGSQPAAEVVAGVADGTGGNPFFIEELVQSAIDGGLLDPATGQWRGSLSHLISGSVRDLVLARVAELRDTDRDLVTWAATCGQRFALPVVAAAAEIDADAALTSIRRLRGASLISEHPDPRADMYAFRHGLIREAVVTDMLEAERRRRHARLLSTFETLDPGSDRWLEECVVHALGASDRQKAFTYSVRAADRSKALAGYAEAGRHLDTSLELWANEDGRAVRARLLLERARLLATAERNPRALDLAREARRIFREEDDPAGAALALAVLGRARFEIERSKEGLADLELARDELSGNEATTAWLEVTANLASALLVFNRIEEAGELARSQLAALRQPAGRDEMIFAIDLQITHGTAMMVLEDGDLGAAILADAAEAAKRIRDDIGAMRAYNNLFGARFHAVDTRTAAEYADTVLSLARQRGLPAEEAFAFLVRAFASTLAGEWRRASELIDEAQRCMAIVGGDPRIRINTLLLHAEIALGRGEVDAAERSWLAALDVIEGVGYSSARAVAHSGLARVGLSRGELEAAVAAIESVIPWLEGQSGSGDPEVAGLALTVCEVRAMAGDGAGTRSCSAILGGERERYARALANIVEGTVLQADAIVEAARGLDAEGRHPEAGRMLMTGADVLALAGEREGAVRLLRLAREKQMSLDASAWCRLIDRRLRSLGASAPAPKTGAGAQGLTRRELEVLQAVADGLSNRGIAERLVISESTAIRHVANIFAKLGVKNRAEAVRVGSEQGILGGGGESAGRREEGPT